jgi:hypothetical protein
VARARREAAGNRFKGNCRFDGIQV